MSSAHPPPPTHPSYLPRVPSCTLSRGRIRNQHILQTLTPQTTHTGSTLQRLYLPFRHPRTRTNPVPDTCTSPYSCHHVM
ncbi:MAG: hypothetical protein ACK56I_06830 [bacterium]